MKVSSTATPAVQTEIRRKMLANGYAPLANKDKMCVLKGWSKLDVTPELIEEWSKAGYRATGVRLDGLLTMVDWDIDNVEMIEDIILHAIETAPTEDSKQRLQDLCAKAPVRFGKGEKEAWFCRVIEGDEGFVRYASAAHCLPGQDPEGDGVVLHRLEVFNGSGRQAGVYGAHTYKNGVVERTYSWLDIGLADVPSDELPVITRADIAHLCDTASAVMASKGWPRHLRSKHGQTAELKVFDLDPGKGLLFETDQHGDVDLDGLIALCEAHDSVRLSASWLEGKAAQNRTRCIADLHPFDGKVAILDTATWQTHRLAAMDSGNRIAELASRLSAVGFENAPVEEGGIFEEIAVEDVLSPVDDRPVITVYGGYINRAAIKTARMMAEHPRFYDYGGEPAVITGRNIEIMSEPRLGHEIANCFDYFKPGKPAGEDQPPNDPIKIDPPVALVKQVMALGKARGLRPLRGVVDVPIINIFGKVISEDGYDADTHLFVKLDDRARELGEAIPDLPTRADMARALETLWSPFREFPFVDAEARGGMLAALLTASIRAVLPTSPAFAFDAPSQGSGKTLLARCVGVLAGGDTGVKLMAPLPVRNEAELAKVLLSVLIDPPRAVIFDNQLGTVDSASFASALTSSFYSGRILGASRTVEVPTSVLFMLTGNNITLGGDMPRRFVRVRIDAKSDAPFMRKFPFDPLVEVKAQRLEMIAAALTLIRGALVAAEGAVKGRMGSFEVWDQMVAQTVLHITNLGVTSQSFGDPLDLIKQVHDTDPQREILIDILTTLQNQFGANWFTIADIWKVISDASSGWRAVADAFEGLSHGKLTKAAISQILRYREGQRCEGLVLDVKKYPKGANKYRVLTESTESEGGVVVEFPRLSETTTKRASDPLS